MRSRAERVYPRDCSFLLTIPASREEFIQDIHSADKDFLQNYRRWEGSEQDKWRRYEPVARDVNAFVDELRGLGVRVVCRATLNDWMEGQGASKVVVLFAHWRNGLVRKEEIRWAEFDALQREPETANDVIARVRRVALENAGDRSRIVDKVNQILVHGQLGCHPWFGQGLNQKAASLEHRVYANRRFLEAALPGIFGRTAGVEFNEGLVDVDILAANALSSFRGVFDLSVCNSSLLGDLLKGNAANCVPVTTRLPANVAFRLIFYRALFKLVKEGRPYVPTIVDLRLRLLEGFKKDDESAETRKIDN